jgi:hypothetical protein
MLIRLLTPVLALALGLGVGLEVGAAGDSPEAPGPSVRVIGTRELSDVSFPGASGAFEEIAGPIRDTRAVEQARLDASWGPDLAPGGAPYDEGGLEHVWWIPPQAGFPEGRIIDGSFEHHAPCEAARADLRVLVFELRSGVTSTLVLVNAGSPRVSVLRAEGASEALVVLERSDFRAGDAIELVAWDVARGRVEELATLGGGGDSTPTWSLESGGTPTLTIRGVDRAYSTDGASSGRKVFERTGIRLETIADLR